VASWNDLDQAFTLPDTIPQESEWRTLYNQLLVRTQTELEHLELSTPEILLVERYLTGYIRLRWAESRVLGDSEGFRDAGMAKDVNQHWLAIANSVTSLIDKARGRHSSDLVNKKAAARVVMDELRRHLTDEGDFRAAALDIAKAFDRMGA
jgi:hypothetical protein